VAWPAPSKISVAFERLLRQALRVTGRRWCHPLAKIGQVLSKAGVVIALGRDTDTHDMGQQNFRRAIEQDRRLQGFVGPCLRLVKPSIFDVKLGGDQQRERQSMLGVCMSQLSETFIETGRGFTIAARKPA